ncbi:MULTISPECIES: nitronate monooxygenase family protein [unclassified Novosphingobium]|uniref:NAD(P)H-dependent flavin oxidoreductase n=1 Tax=unclassified Novosphingobium TaxID=2644732 RepID=UPI000D303F9A|nr:MULTISPECIES: nitronate monooxygenase family protein [unclassified Novosphingobium]PTR05819.1 nitronate monooxygenase [Novosphingobium sp. GV055]PUA94378.1 nitronate monooxygenase [Novosphingobium sp. GV061]PUB12684.1 nitronate monooxygenase [Novosphingobium sp. GV079]PUB38049.1 nitronate monooxygenase [Novosphingobium sp. GV027]
MTLPAILGNRLRLPVIAAPMFLVSQPALVLAQCRAGIVGAFPALNARPGPVLEDWLKRLRSELTDQDAPFAVNLIVHATNERLEHDLALCVKYQVPLVITSLGARPDVFDAVHAYGGFVFHDVINNQFAHKAIEKGADGLVAVAAGAGGHAGTISPFALIQEIRSWFDGPLALSGAIAHGASIAAARALGADFAYMGSAFIATEEANADEAYKQMIVSSGAQDILYSNAFTGIHGNYLIPSIRAAGLDPNALTGSDPSKMSFAENAVDKKAWRDIWGAGQGIGAVDAVVPAAELVARLGREYRNAMARICMTPN